MKWTMFSTLECHEKPPPYRLTEYEWPENQLWSFLFFLIKLFYLYLLRIYNKQNNRSCSWDGTFSHTVHSHFIYDEWQYCYFKHSRTVQREPARSWRGARIATASLTTGTDVPSRILIQARYSRCQHGAGEVFADTQLDETTEFLK